MIAAMIPWARIRTWYSDSSRKRLPMPVNVRNVSTWRLECTHDLPLYWVVARLNPTRLGRRKSLREVSHVPSPTDIVFEVYELLPGGDSCGEGDMVLLEKSCSGQAQDHVETFKSPPSIRLPCDSSITAFSALDIW